MKPERLWRVADLLARMSAVRIDDNWTNKPENSLKAIFRCQMPQTAANVEQRCGVLETIVRRYREVGWRLCLEQFDVAGTVGQHSHRPRWRKDASCAGQPVSPQEAYIFARKALDLAIDWPAQDEHTLGDLVQQMHGLADADQTRIVIESGRGLRAARAIRAKRCCASVSASIPLPAARVSAVNRPNQGTLPGRYDRLAVTDPIVRHQWLFARQWVEEFGTRSSSENFDFHKREEKIAKMREQAIAEVWNAAGYDGILKLCETGEASNIVGSQLAGLAPAGLDPVQLVMRLIADEAAQDGRSSTCAFRASSSGWTTCSATSYWPC